MLKILILAILSLFVSACAMPQKDYTKSVVHISHNGVIGSGFFIADNLILTNRHVVKGQKTVVVRLHGGRVYEGTVEAISFVSDLAIVRIDSKQIDPVLAVSCRSPRFGDKIMAIGHSLGKVEWNVTWGRVSGKRYNQYFIMDIKIFPGNSGGPVIHNGRVVGVATAGFQQFGIFMGINLATTAEDVCRFLNK